MSIIGIVALALMSVIVIGSIIVVYRCRGDLDHVITSAVEDITRHLKGDRRS